MDSLCTGWTYLAQALRGLCSFGEAWTAFSQDGHTLHRLQEVFEAFGSMDSLCTGWTHLAQALRGLRSFGEAWTAFAQDGHTLHRLQEVFEAFGKHGQPLHRMDTPCTGAKMSL